jgi:hypothetical protein
MIISENILQIHLAYFLNGWDSDKFLAYFEKLPEYPSTCGYADINNKLKSKFHDISREYR